MINKLFEMILNDTTKYKINTKKLDELERLTTTTQLIITKAVTSRALNPCYSCSSVLTKHYRELLDMQCLLIQVMTTSHVVNNPAVTVKEIYDYAKSRNIPALKEMEKLIIIAITAGYLERAEKETE